MPQLMYHTVKPFILVAIATVFAASVQTAAPQELTLAAVKIAGARQVTDQDAARLSELQVGEPVTLEALKLAAERLAKTGLFATVQYRYVTASGKLTATFEVEDAVRDIPVILDNFVWFSQAELAEAVRQAVPGFDGKVPRTEDVASYLSRALQRLLATKSVPGQVAVLPEGDTRGNLLRFLFKVENPAPKLCSLAFAEASAQLEPALAAATASLHGTDYSRFSLDAITRGTLTGIYRRRGYWSATFGSPSVQLDSGCGGVVVTLPVREGSVYTWDRPIWTGNASIPSATLDSILGFKSGDVADGARLESALLNVAKAYGKVGFLQANTTPTPQLDEATRRVTFTIAVEEGPQFRMGALTITGLPEKDAEALRKRWTMGTGDVFDDSYAGAFVAKEGARYRRQGAPPPRVEYQGNMSARTIDVTITFQ
jgi:outer membrane protein assembly factor BamA